MNPLPEHGRRVAIYARVSTSDRDQNVETQLMPLREFCAAQGWEVYEEHVDQVPATDLAHRTAWRELLEDASKRKFDLLLVWRMDRAFRSVLDAATTLERLRTWGVGLRSYSEPWLDTTSPWPTPSWSGGSSEKGSRREWSEPVVRAAGSADPVSGTGKGFPDVLERLNGGDISRRQAAKELGIGYATLKRLLDADSTGTREGIV